MKKVFDPFKMFITSFMLTVLFGTVVLADATKTVVENIQQDTQYSTLSTVIQSANLGDSLETTGTYTIFAPTNDAFSKLSSNVQNALGQPENQETLKKILQYHIVEGKVTSSQLQNQNSVNTLEGSPIEVAISGNEVTLNSDSKVTSPDTEASNGVIHGIDTVLIPPGVNVSDLEEGSSNPGSSPTPTPTISPESTP